MNGAVDMDGNGCIQDKIVLEKRGTPRMKKVTLLVVSQSLKNKDGTGFVRDKFQPVS
jgi:hypothetical protein